MEQQKNDQDVTGNIFYFWLSADVNFEMFADYDFILIIIIKK